jgi:DNA-directed RNA polymerase I subunit RPA1
MLQRGLISRVSDLESLKGNLAIDGELNGDVVEIQESTTGTSEVVTYKFISKSSSNEIDQNVGTVKTKHVWELQRQLISQFFKECSVSKCPNCSAPVRPIRQEHHAKVFMKPLSQKLSEVYATMWSNHHEKSEVNNVHRDTVAEDCLKQKYVTPLEAQQHLRAVFANEWSLLHLMFGNINFAENQLSPADTFFLDVMVVPPSRYRPISSLGDKKFENPQTANLQKVLQDCLAIKGILENKVADTDVVSKTKPSSLLAESLHSAWLKLQMDVNCFVDSDLDKMKGKDVPSGIRQVLEKKEGLFRKHMMGKRVNFAARSVISPDPYINMDEVGVPLVFATKLTYPESVTPLNVQELSRAVINGPLKHPGATHVEREDGSTVILSRDNLSQRQGIAKQLLTPPSGVKSQWGRKKVYRHLRNGDILLMNRQPTLHKPSIMAHKARVLPGERTLRLHYANCKTYNADFDGDEMNAHFPQNELARSEAYNIGNLFIHTVYIFIL